MAQLRQDYDKFVKQEGKILVVGPEGPDRFKTYWKANDLPFIGLPDPDHLVLKLFGQEVNLFKLGRMPAQVIMDKRGLARYVHYGNSMSDIPDNQELLEILGKLNQETKEPSE
jgi:peroxiredoxin